MNIDKLLSNDITWEIHSYPKETQHGKLRFFLGRVPLSFVFLTSGYIMKDRDLLRWLLKQQLTKCT